VHHTLPRIWKRVTNFVRSILFKYKNSKIANLRQGSSSEFTPVIQVARRPTTSKPCWHRPTGHAARSPLEKVFLLPSATPCSRVASTWHTDSAKRRLSPRPPFLCPFSAAQHSFETATRHSRFLDPSSTLGFACPETRAGTTLQFLRRPLIDLLSELRPRPTDHRRSANFRSELTD
jgi:hypothetical protein